MSKLHIGIIDLLTNSGKPSLWGRIMMGNYAGIMPQAIAVWCRESGHEVSYFCYTSSKDLKHCIQNFDFALISAFTQSAQMAYAMSSLLRSRGTITALGGPHARSYPADAARYFDYVFGLTNKSLLLEVLADLSPRRPQGIFLSASKQPDIIPGVRKRWPFIKIALNRAPLVKVIPMIASFGCPYSCGFCVDAHNPYQPLDLETIKEDLLFITASVKNPIVAWCDNNFGIHFNEIMTVIEENITPGRISFIAESSLSVLNEKNVVRMKKNGYKVLLPGIESWYKFGNKSNTPGITGVEKVEKVSRQINMILSHIPYLQINFIFPLDEDHGSEPFELTQQFIEKTPGVFPSYAMLSAFGCSAPDNIQYQRENRIIPVPFHVLDAQMDMNVRPKHYSWPDFYRHLKSLTKKTFSKKILRKRFRANPSVPLKLLNLFRGITSQGIGRTKLCDRFLNRFERDGEFRAFFQQDTLEMPRFYLDWVRKDLGPLWEWLPEGAMDPGSTIIQENNLPGQPGKFS